MFAMNYLSMGGGLRPASNSKWMQDLIPYLLPYSKGL